jgi:hypothetical protein
MTLQKVGKSNLLANRGNQMGFGSARVPTNLCSVPEADLGAMSLSSISL